MPQVRKALKNSKKFNAPAEIMSFLAATKNDLNNVLRVVWNHPQGPLWAAMYTKYVVHRGYWREAIPLIQKDPEACLWFAKNHIESSWLPGEETMKKDPEVWSRYLAFCEPNIENAIRFSQDRIERGFWGEFHTDRFEGVLKDLKSADPSTPLLGLLKNHKFSGSYWALLYCVRMEHRWGEAEEFISNYTENIVRYASSVVRGRWPMGEEALLNYATPEEILSYCRRVVRDRWEGGEKRLARDGFIALEYAEEFLFRWWPEAEQGMIDFLVKSTDTNTCSFYFLDKLVKYIIKYRKSRWLKFEVKLQCLLGNLKKMEEECWIREDDTAFARKIAKSYYNHFLI